MKKYINLIMLSFVLIIALTFSASAETYNFDISTIPEATRSQASYTYEICSFNVSSAVYTGTVQAEIVKDDNGLSVIMLTDDGTKMTPDGYNGLVLMGRKSISDDVATIEYEITESSFIVNDYAMLGGDGSGTVISQGSGTPDTDAAVTAASADASADTGITETDASSESEASVEEEVSEKMGGSLFKNVPVKLVIIVAVIFVVLAAAAAAVFIIMKKKSGVPSAPKKQKNQPAEVNPEPAAPVIENTRIDSGIAIGMNKEIVENFSIPVNYNVKSNTSYDVNSYQAPAPKPATPATPAAPKMQQATYAPAPQPAAPATPVAPQPAAPVTPQMQQATYAPAPQPAAPATPVAPQAPQVNNDEPSAASQKFFSDYYAGTAAWRNDISFPISCSNTEKIPFGNVPEFQRCAPVTTGYVLTDNRFIYLYSEYQAEDHEVDLYSDYFSENVLLKCFDIISGRTAISSCNGKAIKLIQPASVRIEGSKFVLDQKGKIYTD